MQMRLQFEINERYELAYSLAAFQFGPLFHERHRVASGSSTTGPCRARGLCGVLGIFSVTEFRVVRGKPALGHGTGTRSRYQAFDRQT